MTNEETLHWIAAEIQIIRIKLERLLSMAEQVVAEDVPLTEPQLPTLTNGHVTSLPEYKRSNVRRTNLREALIDYIGEKHEPFTKSQFREETGTDYGVESIRNAFLYCISQGHIVEVQRGTPTNGEAVYARKLP